MPFAMTHLYIADNILRTTPEIKNQGDFLLGALAPDAVHFRDNYNSDMKKASHLCVGPEKWGRLTNNKEWVENILAFLDDNKTAENADFIYGYCSHVLADVQNNIKIWTPFLKENLEMFEKGLGSYYHEESTNLDYVLYLNNPQQKVIWKLLETSRAYDIEGLVSEDEIEEMKVDLLNERFAGREIVDISANRYATLPCLEEFITEESKYIKSLLYKNL